MSIKISKTRVCWQCKIRKQLNRKYFYRMNSPIKRAIQAQGFQYNCKECNNKRTVAWQQKNRVLVNIRSKIRQKSEGYKHQKVYYYSHIEKIKKYQRKYNKLTNFKSSKDYYQRNKSWLNPLRYKLRKERLKVTRVS